MYVKMSYNILATFPGEALSILSPLLFVIVMEALSREFRVTLPWELLYAADLAVIAETEDDLIKRLNEWKDNMENRGMRVNMNKTKITISGEWQKVMQKAVRWPCGVYGRGIGNKGLNTELWCIPSFTSTFPVTINCSYDFFCTCIHRHDYQYYPFFNSQLMHYPSYYFSQNPITTFFQTQKAKTELLSFSSKLLLHLSYNKNGVSGSSDSFT